MISLKKDNSGKGFVMTMQYGNASREYAGRLVICENPSCACADVGIDLNPVTEKQVEHDRSSQACAFEVDLHKRALSKRMTLEEPERSFARQFVASLDGEQWGLLWNLFAEQKSELSEAEDLDGAKLFFPEKIIENGSSVGYHELLPFGTGFNLTKTDIRLVLEDSYCLRTGCTCTNAGLAFIALEDPLKRQQGLQTVLVDYKTKKWDFSNAEGKIPIERSLLRTAVEREWPNIYSLLKKRHGRLKALYRGFKEAKKLKTESETPIAVSRNAPCPCGSGKKYKRCCGRDR